MIKSILIGIGAAGISALMLLQSWPAAKISSGSGKGDPTRPYSFKSDAPIKANQALLRKEQLSADIAPRLRINAKKTLESAPLNEDAVFHLAIADILENPQADIIPLLTEANLRNARNRRVLKTLIQQQSSTGDIKGILKNVDILYRLERDDQGTYLTILDLLYQNANARAEIGQYLESDPDWAYIFLARQVGSFYERFVNIDELTALVKTYVRQSKDTTLRTRLVERYLYLLVKLNRPEEAYNYWRELYQESGSSVPTINNSKFTELDAAPPFNWKLFYGPTGGAEFDDSSGLFAFHNSEVAQLIARQYIHINPTSSYALKAKVFGSISPQKGWFEWRMTCISDKTLWHVTPIIPDNVSDDMLTDILPPAASETCTFVDVKLYGLPGTYADRFNLQIASLELSPFEETTP